MYALKEPNIPLRIQLILFEIPKFSAVGTSHMQEERAKGTSQLVEVWQ